ncbi:MAG: class I SAM-dependent methyltransferase [archaeon]
MKKEEWEKIASNYHEEILSPLKHCKDNILVRDLSQIKDCKKKDIADLGCGPGEIENFLSSTFRNVTAIDFSQKMIEIAKEKNKELENVEFISRDMSDMGDMKDRFDVALAINSIISPDVLQIQNTFLGVHNILKSGGKFFAILPAMEVFIYQSMILAHKELSKGKNHQKTVAKIKRHIKKKEHDFLLGIVDFEGKQKAFYNFEIMWRLKKAGFRNIRIDKICYSWESFKDAGQLSFPDEELPWDWYVVCEK